MRNKNPFFSCAPVAIFRANCYTYIMQKKIIPVSLALVLGLLICNPLTAESPGQPLRLSPDEAVQMAVRNNLSLESARISAGTRRRASDLSWNQFVPNITVSGTLNRLNEAPQDMTFPLPPPIGTISIPGGSQWQAIGSLQTSLTINMAMFENMNLLRRDFEMGLLSYETARAQLERDIRKTYHNMLLLQENIALLWGSFSNAERQVQMAQANFNAGLVPELTLLQAQVARENMRPVIDQAENGLRLSMAQFAMLLGLPFDTQFEFIPVSGDAAVVDPAAFIPIDVAEMISRAAVNRPDILELRQRILMLESGRKAQSLALTPNLILSWNYNPILSDPWNTSWFDGNNWTDRGSFSITLGMRLHSLFPFSIDTQAIRNLDDQIRAANIGLAQMIRGTEIEVYNTILALERTRLSAEVLAQTVNLAERSFQLTEQAYRAGLQDFFQVQNAEQSLRQARVQLLEQQFNYLNSLIDLEYAIGVPFGTLSNTGSR